MADGIVYVLTNPAMPKMVKIGRTGNDVDTRLSQLYSTGVPLPFECAYAARVADMDKVEKAFHNAFGPYRVNPKREFFSIEPEQAIGLLDVMKLEDVTPEVQLEAEQVDVEGNTAATKFTRLRSKPKLNYLEMGIELNSALVFIDGKTICKVLNERKVLFKDVPWSLTALTKELLGVPGKSIGGPAKYWTYQSKSLSEIYRETYSEED